MVELCLVTKVSGIAAAPDPAHCLGGARAVPVEPYTGPVSDAK